MMRRELGKNCSLLAVIAFIAIGCTHSVNNTSTIETPASNKTVVVDAISSHESTYIIPPIQDSNLVNNSATKIDGYDFLIWKRITNNLALTEHYLHPRVVAEEENYLKDEEFLSKVTEQAEPFLYFITEEISKRDMPAELAIVPIVESSFRTRARSRARAAGLWQFMPYTAREYGLQTSNGYDARYDVYASTLAALNYLSQLHSDFDSDWLLALAAYNAGPQRIKRALRASDDNKNTFWDLQLPRETQKYVPKILALGSIIESKAEQQTILHPVADTPYFRPVEVKKKISTSKLVELAGIDSKEVRMLNPAIQHLHFPIPTGYHLLVPKDDMELVCLTIENMPEEKFTSWTKHKISRGESLSTIAKSYNTTISKLCAANNLSSNLIKAGHTLLIPPIDDESTATTVVLNTPQLPLQKSNNSDVPYMYTVARGDSFWKIAARNNTTVERLTEINGRSPEQPLLPGESILID